MKIPYSWEIPVFAVKYVFFDVKAGFSQNGNLCNINNSCNHLKVLNISGP